MYPSNHQAPPNVRQSEIVISLQLVISEKISITAIKSHFVFLILNSSFGFVRDPDHCAVAPPATLVPLWQKTEFQGHKFPGILLGLPRPADLSQLLLPPSSCLDSYQKTELTRHEFPGTLLWLPRPGRGGGG